MKNFFCVTCIIAGLIAANVLNGKSVEESRPEDGLTTTSSKDTGLRTRSSVSTKRNLRPQVERISARGAASDQSNSRPAEVISEETEDRREIDHEVYFSAVVDGVAVEDLALVDVSGEP